MENNICLILYAMQDKALVLHVSMLIALLFLTGVVYKIGTEDNKK